MAHLSPRAEVFQSKLYPGPLRVMHVMGGLIRSGVDSIILTLAEGLRQIGGEAVLVPLVKGRIAEEAGELGLTVDPLGKKFRYDLFSILKLARLIKKHKIDILHSWEVNGAFYACPAGRLAGVAQVNSWQIDPRESLKQIYRRRLFRQLSFRYYIWLMRFCQRVITATPELHRALIDGGVSPIKVNYMPNGIDVDAYDFKENTRKTILSELKLPSDVTVIGTACRLQLIKNIPMLLKTAKRLIDAKEKVRFVIVGDGTERQMLEDMVAELQITEYVRFTGWRTDAPKLMSAFDIFALTSKDEGMPIVVLEAMALGKPVVGTNVGAMNECVLHGQTGLLVPSDNVNQMTEFLRLLVRDKDRACRFGEAGRTLVKRQFSKEIMVQRTLEVYSAAVDPISVSS